MKFMKTLLLPTSAVKKSMFKWNKCLPVYPTPLPLRIPDFEPPRGTRTDPGSTVVDGNGNWADRSDNRIYERGFAMLRLKILNKNALKVKPVKTLIKYAHNRLFV